jgi:flagellar protein FliS
MFGSAQSGARAYAKVGMETGVSAASPHKLIVMLFDGAMVAVTMGLHHMRTGNIAAKGKSISHAISIIGNGLRASLDKEVGGEIAVNLDALYQYMGDRLLMGNIKNQPEALEEVHGLLKDLKGAWESIGTEQVQQTAQMAPPVVARDPLMPHTSRLVKA